MTAAGPAGRIVLVSILARPEGRALPLVTVTVVEVSVLQWGHGISTVEIITPPTVTMV